MRSASALVLALGLGFVLAAPARAENWVHTRDSGSGNPICFDKDSVTTKADGLSYWAARMCDDKIPQWYAVDCTRNFKYEFLVCIYDIGSTEKYREMTMDYPESGLAIDAEMVCHKG